jgi:hypothetical protein
MSFQELIELVGKAVDAGGVGIVVGGVLVATVLAVRMLLQRQNGAQGYSSERTCAGQAPRHGRVARGLSMVGG